LTDAAEIEVYAVDHVTFLDFTVHTPDVSTHGAMQPGDFQRNVGVMGLSKAPAPGWKSFLAPA
jgi:hypothetical protein